MDSETTIQYDQFNTSDHDESIFVQEETMFIFYVCGPVLSIFIILGLFGNSACLYVFRPRKAGNTPPIYVYLFALAIWDLALLLGSFILYNLPELTQGNIIGNELYMNSTPYLYCATNAAHTSANWTVLALGLERYFALCHPFKHRMLSDGRKRATYVVIVISVAGVLYSLPRLFELNSEESSECGPVNSIRQNVFYRTVYKIVGGTLLYSVGPFLILLIVTIRVSTAIRKQRIFQKATLRRSCRVSTNHQNQERDPNRDQCSYSINIMLISVIMKLLFVHSLPTALDMSEMIMGDENYCRNGFIDYLIIFLNLLLAINSSCNWFIYYVCSKRFRLELARLYCSRQNYISSGLTSTIIINERISGRIGSADPV